MNREFDPRYDAKIIQIIEEFQQTGTSTVAEEWKAKFPRLAEALTLCAVDGIGPKRALILCREGYRNLDELAAAAREGKFDKRGNLRLAAMQAKAAEVARSAAYNRHNRR
jgi:DNA polymerase/3'-5' exonuclease PolX